MAQSALAPGHHKPWFADEAHGLAGEEQELANLVNRLEKNLPNMAWRLVPKRQSYIKPTEK